MTTIWTARIVPVDPHPDPPTPTRERWKSSEFAVAGERPWRIPVLVAHHRDLQVGHLYLLRERRGWAEADFVLTDAEAEQVMRIGQPVSIGGRQLTGKVKLRWINELSLVAEGAIRGAEVIGRRELRTTPAPLPPAPAKPKPAAAPPLVAAAAPPVLRRTSKAQRDAIETAELRRRHDWLLDHGYSVSLEEVLDNLKSEVGYGRDLSREWRKHGRAA